MGIAREREADSLCWHEFFLSFGALMFYVTYTAPAGDKGQDRAAVEFILSKIVATRYGA